MVLRGEQRCAILGGIWLIGFGVLFATRAWWPGIMFLLAITAIVEGWLENRSWYGIQGGFWAFFIGVWALTRFSLPLLLVGLGISSIVGAFTRPGPSPKPKPFVDSSFE